MDFLKYCKAFSTEKYKHFILNIIFVMIMIIILLLSATLVMLDCQIPGNEVVYYN